MIVRRLAARILARSPRLLAVYVWYIWRTRPEARPGLYVLLYGPMHGEDRPDGEIYPD